MTDSKTIRYEFSSKGEEVAAFDVTLHKHATTPPYEGKRPEWTRLEFHQCEGCQLKEAQHCPVAIRLVEPAQMMGRLVSHDQVAVRVKTQEREYYRETDVQQGLMALFGLIMATSGCPTMEPMRPMAWHHLPFASFEETLFRMVSAHLLSNYFNHKGQQGNVDILEEIEAIYEDIGKVNQGIINRLRASAMEQRDASFNALVTLDSYASLVSFSVKNQLQDLEQLFQQAKDRDER
jgi:hypothetical protein